jgi:hypothetical protein
MRPLFNHKIGAILLCLCMITSDTAFAQKAQLTHIIITNTRDDLLLYMNVEGAFREKMNTAIFSGVPASFSFIINLYQVKKMWKDKKIAARKITSTIKYDTLKKEFLIHRSWKNSGPVVVKSFQEAQKLMTEISSLKIIPLARLEKGQQYQIRTKAELSKLTLPFYLHYILFFVSLWDFETDWYTIDFIY